MDILNALFPFMILIGIVWIVLAVRKSRAAGNRYWQTAATTLGLKYNYKFGLKYSRESYLHFDLQKQVFPRIVDELKLFLPVLEDRAHIFAPVRVLSGIHNSEEVLLMEATGGFARRTSLLPAQTSAFYFIGHTTVTLSQPALLVLPNNPKIGDKLLTPTKEMQSVESSVAYTAYSSSPEDPRAVKLLNLLDTYPAEEGLHVLLTGNSIYLYSTYRPDLVRWATLLHEVAHLGEPR